MKKIFGLIFILIIAISCGSDGDTTPTPSGPVDVFKINVESGAFPVSSEIWFVAWDDDGTLLNHGKYVTGETLTLTTEETITNNKATLGIFRNRPGGSDYQLTHIAIFTDLAPGTEVNFQSPASIGTSPGKFRLSVSNAPVEWPISVTSKYGPAARQTIPTDENVLVYDISMTGDAKDYLINSYSAPDKYMKLNDVAANDEYEVDFNNFSTYDKQATINLPSEYNQASIIFRGGETGMPLGQNYTLGSFQFSESMESSATVYYYSEITQFGTTVSIDHPSGYISYNKYGTLPGTITWPNPSKYTITSFDPNSFAVSVNEQVEYIYGSWYHDDEDDNFYIGLDIYSPKLSPKIGKVPAEMIAIQPRFEIKKEFYNGGSVDFITKGSRSYQETFANYRSKTLKAQEAMTVTIIPDL